MELKPPTPTIDPTKVFVTQDNNNNTTNIKNLINISNINNNNNSDINNIINCKSAVTLLKSRK